MKDIPVGRVTFLFTGIEGGTKLSQEFPQELQSALSKHSAILKNTIDSNNGFVFKIASDEFCCAFEKAEDAVKAAIDIQKNLKNENWDNVKIKIRIGIHSGNAEWNGSDYMGYVTLARTARIKSAAHGEQILISEETFKSFENSFSGDNNISFRDLGERRLKDLIQPIRLFQISTPELRLDFPPLKTIDARPNNLRVQISSFIGRDNEISQIKKTLSTTRLLTLVGSGGTGKTRLALQVAADLIDEYTDGVWCIELSTLTDPLLILETIADTLNVKEQPGQKLESILIDYFKDKKILLILDNCEHFIEACSELSEKFLRQTKDLKIVATSRITFRCDGEMTHKVLPLSHPDPNAEYTPIELSQYEAVRLFIERALQVNPAFRVNDENVSALAQICSRLDGIPLAVELAAVRCKVLSLKKICEKLDDRFKLLTGGSRTALPRQQTLKALVDWSYDILKEKEKILWRRFSIFNGGCTLEECEKICSDDMLNEGEILDLIQNLCDNSIVAYTGQNDKYTMLETIRQYGNEKLNEAGEEKIFKTMHLEYFMNLCEGAVSEYKGSNVKKWLDLIEEFYPNVQSALAWSLDNGLREEGTRLAVSMGKFWELRGHYMEGRNWFQKIINNPGDVSPEIIANAKSLAAVLAALQTDYKTSQRYLEEALEFYRNTNNKNGIGNCLNNLGLNYFDLGEYKKSKLCMNEGLEIRKKTNNRIGICSTLNSLGLVALAEGEFSSAKEYFEESLDIAIELKDLIYMAIGYNNLAQIYQRFGNYEKAKDYFEKGLSIDRELGNKLGICVSIYNLGLVEQEKKDFIAAKKYFEESLKIGKEIDSRQIIPYSLLGMGQIALEEKKYDDAEKLFKECLNFYTEFAELQTTAGCIVGIAELKIKEGKYELAANLIAASREKYKLVGAFIEDKFEVQINENLNSIINNIGDERAKAAIDEGKVMLFEAAIEKAINS